MAPPRRVDEAILQALTQILQNQQNPVPTPPPPPPEGTPGTYTWVANQLIRNNTPTYGGEIDPVALTAWFRELEKSFSLYDVRNEFKVKLASHFLVKEADAWWSMVGPTSSLEPGFDWDRFKELVEARFYPKELKQQRLKEFMELKQGSLSVQAFTKKFNELAHYATRLVKDENEEAFFYLDKLTPKLKSMIRRESTSFVSIYDDALWAENSLKAIDEETRATNTALGKRPFYPSSKPYAATPRSYVAPTRPTSSFSYPNKKRFVPSGQANRGVQALTSNNNKDAKDRVCYNCKKPAHPGVPCSIVCFFCHKPGHKANVCPEKKMVATTTPTAPERPKDRIFLMSRAEAEANPDIVTGYLKETVSDVYRFLSVSVKGAEYLSSAHPDWQPPLVLPLLDEMCEEEIERSHVQVGGLKSSTPSESEGLSEDEVKLYHALLEERMKLARVAGTAPYAVCGDATIKKIALVRPSTKARLANIDGVNQHLVVTHGDHFLQAIRKVSRTLDLSLDGEMNQRKLTPSKLEACKMWHDNRLSIQKIANFPGRSAPIRERTVLSYLLEAAQEGFEVDWPRLCDEIELTSEMFRKIMGAVKMVGSTERLKPIKDELPEDISYSHISVCLAMTSCGISSLFEPMHSDNKTEVPKSESSESSANTPTKRSCGDDQPFAKNGNSQETGLSSVEQSFDKHSSKGSKIDQEDSNNNSGSLEATPGSILDWIRNNENGVGLDEILKHFKGSSEDIRNMLVGLEAKFIIYQKNGVYRLL